MAHQEGQVNREDRIIQVHTQTILTLFITILRSTRDLGGTRLDECHLGYVMPLRHSRDAW